LTQILKLLNALVPQVADLSREMPCEVRYQRLLDSLNLLIPADASALLQLEGEELTPVAIQGLHAGHHCRGKRMWQPTPDRNSQRDIAREPSEENGPATEGVETPCGSGDDGRQDTGRQGEITLSPYLRGRSGPAGSDRSP